MSRLVEINIGLFILYVLFIATFIKVVFIDCLRSCQVRTITYTYINTLHNNDDDDIPLVVIENNNNQIDLQQLEENNDICLENNECSICLESLSLENNTILITECNHMFHINCINKLQKCPLCRASLKYKQYVICN